MTDLNHPGTVGLFIVKHGFPLRVEDLLDVPLDAAYVKDCMRGRRNPSREHHEQWSATKEEEDGGGDDA